jgi:hypothetical protein
MLRVSVCFPRELVEASRDDIDGFIQSATAGFAWQLRQDLRRFLDEIDHAAA